MSTMQLNAINDYMLNGTAEMSLLCISTIILICCGKFLSDKQTFDAYIWKIGIPIYVYVLINFSIFQGGDFKKITAVNAYALSLLIVLFYMIIVPFLDKYEYKDIKKNFIDIFPLYIVGFTTFIFLLNKILPDSVLKLSVFTNMLTFFFLLTFSIWTTLQMKGLRIDILNISTIWKTYLRDGHAEINKPEKESEIDKSEKESEIDKSDEESEIDKSDEESEKSDEESEESDEESDEESEESEESEYESDTDKSEES